MDNNVCEPITQFNWDDTNCGEIFWYKSKCDNKLELGYKCWCDKLHQTVLIDLNRNEIYTDIKNYIIVSKVNGCLVEDNEY